MTEAPFAKDAARKMRKELADLEADQAKATCWGAAVGERRKRIDALRRELARQTDTRVDDVWRYNCGKNKTMVLKHEGNWVKYSDYAALASERDAAVSNVEQWRTMWEKEHDHNAALQAKLDEALNQLDSARHSVAVLENRLGEAVGALESVKIDLELRAEMSGSTSVELGASAWIKLCATLTKLKGETDE